MRYMVVAALCVALAGCATSNQRLAGCTTTNQKKLARCAAPNQKTAFNDGAIDQPMTDQSWSSEAYSSNAPGNRADNAHMRAPDQAAGRPFFAGFDGGGGNRQATFDSPRSASSAGGGHDFAPPAGGRGHDFSPPISSGHDYAPPASSAHDFSPPASSAHDFSPRIPDSPAVATTSEPSTPPSVPSLPDRPLR